MSENRSVYDMMLYITVGTARQATDDITIRRMRVATG
jgi:hypothetical protein